LDAAGGRRIQETCVAVESAERLLIAIWKTGTVFSHDDEFRRAQVYEGGVDKTSGVAEF
jgi:hypothetical protein